MHTAVFEDASNKRRDRTAPLAYALGIFSAAFTVTLAAWLHFSWVVVLLGLIPGIATIAAIRLLARKASTPVVVVQEAAPDTQDSENDRNLAALCGGVVPVWQRQIETTRAETEHAITDLAGRFASMSQKLEAAVQASRRTAGGMQGEGSMTAMLEAARNDLDEIVAALRSAMDNKQALLEQVSSLAGFTAELQGMAQEVAQIAGQTNLLALNAAIEAARAGEAGRGFSVVADAVRTLSNQSGQTGRRIAEKVEEVNRAIGATLSAAQETAKLDTVAAANAEQQVVRILDRFGRSAQELADGADLLRAESDGIRQEVAEVLVALQFQDRVSQMLTHVERDMDKLRRGLSGDAHQALDFDVGAWLSELKRSYTTAEQHVAHDGQSVNGPAASVVTFF